MNGRLAVSIVVMLASDFVKRRNSPNQTGEQKHAREGGWDKNPEAGQTASSLAWPLHTQHGQGDKLNALFATH
jgi:hypothetical protein